MDNEFNDHLILNVSEYATLRQIKDAYYEQVRIYHPDSKHFDNILTKQDKVNIIQKINKAYSNLKQKLNIQETDLPQLNIEYEPINISQTIKPTSKIHNILIKEENQYNDEIKNKIDSIKLFNERFNKKFIKKHKLYGEKDPYSIFYKEPKIKNLNLNNINNEFCKFNESNQIVLHSNFNENHNLTELGINYVNDYSGNNNTDIYYSNIQILNELDKNKLDENIFKNQSKKLERDNSNENLNDLLEKKKIEREQKIIPTQKEQDDIEYIKCKINEIELSKKKIYQNQLNLLIN